MTFTRVFELYRNKAIPKTEINPQVFPELPPVLGKRKAEDDNSEDVTRFRRVRIKVQPCLANKDQLTTIMSPDEEMRGKAVALFDFESEFENELPLVEGQIIWVSYRHGQGWLVAEDPKTSEAGLVPEEYVRLLRDLKVE